MVNQELLNYIRSALASGQSRETIIQTLLQNGWEDNDIQEGFRIALIQEYSNSENKGDTADTSQQQREINTANTDYVQNSIQSQKGYSRSALSIAIIAGIVVIIVGIGVTFWVLTRSSAAPSYQTQLSEIDKYGVDLYTLKQGTTTTEKMIDDKNTKVVYIRNKNEVTRKASIVYTDGGEGTSNTTINLNSKEILLAQIKETEKEIEKKCKNTTPETDVVYGDCKVSQKALDLWKNNCLTLVKNEEISACMAGAVSQATMEQYYKYYKTQPQKITTDQYGTDLTKLPEGKTVKVFKDPPTDEVDGNKTTVTYERNGNTVTISEYILMGGGSGNVEYTSTVSLE